MKIGKAKYSGDKKEIFKIKDGDNIYRPLPPLGNLADVGVWSKYYRVVWGYKDSKGQNRPFVSPYQKNFKSGMVEADCAAFRKSAKIKDEYQAMVKDAKEFSKNGGVLSKEMKDAIDAKKEEMTRFNIDSKHYLNAISLDGKIGLLKLAGTGMKALRSLAKKLEGEGVDITGVEGGRFVNVSREGTGLDTQYQVVEYKQNVQVTIDGKLEIVQRSVPHNLDDSIINRLAHEAFELDKLYPAPSSEEVARIIEAFEVSEAEGAKVLEEVLGDSSPSSSSDSSDDEQLSSQSVAETKVEQRAEAVKESVKTSVVEQKAETTKVVSGEVVNTKTGEIIEEKKVETPAAHMTNAAAQSDEDFLAGLKV